MKKLLILLLLPIFLSSRPKPDFLSLLHNLETAINGWRTGASDNGYQNTLDALQQIHSYDTTGKLPTILGLYVCAYQYQQTLIYCGPGYFSAPCQSVAWSNFVSCCGQYGYTPGLKEEEKENE